MNVCGPWSAPYKDTENGTCLMLALSNEQYHVVEWLEKEKGAAMHRAKFNQQKKFQSMGMEFARDEFYSKYFNEE